MLSAGACPRARGRSPESSKGTPLTLIADRDIQKH